MCEAVGCATATATALTAHAGRKLTATSATSLSVRRLRGREFSLTIALVPAGCLRTREKLSASCGNFPVCGASVCVCVFACLFILSLRCNRSV